MRIIFRQHVASKIQVCSSLVKVAQRLHILCTSKQGQDHYYSQFLSHFLVWGHLSFTSDIIINKVINSFILKSCHYIKPYPAEFIKWKNYHLFISFDSPLSFQGYQHENFQIISQQSILVAKINQFQFQQDMGLIINTWVYSVV